MEMYTMSDYLMVNGIYKVRAVDAGGMYINPDRKEERRNQEWQDGSPPSGKEKKSANKALEYNDVLLKEVEAARQRKRRTENENTPFWLWMYMTGRQNQVILDREITSADKMMELFIEEQERAQAKLAGKETVSFNAKA